MGRLELLLESKFAEECLDNWIYKNKTDKWKMIFYHFLCLGKLLT